MTTAGHAFFLTIESIFAYNEPNLLRGRNRMVTALIFPGQGTQKTGMGRKIFNESPPARALFNLADEVLGFKISDLCFDGAKEELERTSICQLAVFVNSLAHLEELKEQKDSPFPMDMVAGHSLGEFTALVAAGSMDFEQVLLLVKERALIMEDPGTFTFRWGRMFLVKGLSETKVAKICAVYRDKEKYVDIACINAPDQFVISGEHWAVESAAMMAYDAGADEPFELKTSGPFHSVLMTESARKFIEILQPATIHAPSVKFFSSITGEETSDPEIIRGQLAIQMVTPVQWVKTIRAMAKAGATEYIELPKGFLTRLLGKKHRD